MNRREFFKLLGLLPLVPLGKYVKPQNDFVMGWDIETGELFAYDKDGNELPVYQASDGEWYFVDGSNTYHINCEEGRTYTDITA